jgi:chaperonin cofactor prefoldin
MSSQSIASSSTEYLITSVGAYATGRVDAAAPSAAVLATRVQALEKELKALMEERNNLQNKLKTECSNALYRAVQGLHELVEQVALADKSLLFWYKKAAPLRILMKPLKLIGRGRDADSIIAKHGPGIRSRADMVSRSFDECSDICVATLSEIQQLHLRTNVFVESGVGGVQNDAERLVRTHQRKKEDLEIEIKAKQRTQETVQVELSTTNARVRALEWKEVNARKAAKKSATVSWHFLGHTCLSTS